MPGGDRTGPSGMGPMTGRGLGWCAGPRLGRRFGAAYGSRGWSGWGRGRGWRNRYYATGIPGWAGRSWRRWGISPAGYFPPTTAPAIDQLEDLKAYAEEIEQELNEIRAQMAELEKRAAQAESRE